MKLLTILMAIAIVILILCETTPLQEIPVKVRVNPNGMVFVEYWGNVRIIL